jgi:hypothetical protein
MMAALPNTSSFFNHLNGSGGRGRTMRRWPMALLVAMLAMLMASPLATAGVTWCRSDPIVRLGNVEYSIVVSLPEQNLPQIDDALRFWFFSPYGTTQQTLSLDAGFNGLGEVVRYGSYLRPWHTMILDVRHTGERFPVMVDVYQNGTHFRSVSGSSGLIVLTLPLS